MYLKNLTTLGFKSFADKTSLNFLPGITAIVGPNGCGKSNVADSLRWVLGEQSAKALRGEGMADVIFNGTDTRKAMGMAEVSVTIGDVDKDQLRAAGVDLDYNEVTVTRRIFRDGVSEYYINKTSCRLKDIQQLFMGTGIGRTSYSIMAQGHITQLLSSRPEDRRMVFEEAAGITRFKAQKRESLRKLDATEQNLLRVADLIREVKRQIGSLQRQAGKARRYKQLMMELQHLDTQLARHQYDVLENEIKERQQTADRLRIELEVCSESILRGEDEISQLRTRMTELEHRVALTQRQSLELKNQVDQHQSRIQINDERLREFEQQNAKALTDIAEGEERRRIAEQELASVTEQLAASQAKMEQMRQNLQAGRDGLQRVENELRLKQESVRQAQSEAFATGQQLTRVRNEINTLEMQKQGNAVRLEKLSAEKIQLEEERRRTEASLNEFRASVEAEKQNVQTRRITIEEKQARLREIQQELNRIGRELDEALRQQAGLRSRLNVLEQLQTSHEGFSAGALAALKQSPNMLGALVDKIRVPNEYVAATEAALGHYLQLILTEAPETACQILTELKAQRKGGASIAALSLLAGIAETSTATAITSLESATPQFHEAPASEFNPAAEGALEAGSQAPVEPLPSATNPLAAGLELPRLIDMVEADDSVKPLLQRLIGRTLVAADFAEATAAWRQRQGAEDIVTRGGEFLSRHGVFTGGAGSGTEKSAASILARKNQIAELQEQLASIQSQVNELSLQKGALQSEQNGLQASWQQDQTELRSQEVAIATHQGECRALENSLRVLHQKVDTVVFEIQNLAEQEQEGSKKREGLAGQIAALEGRESAAQQRIADFVADLEALRQQREEANNALTEVKVSQASEEQLLGSLRQQQQTQTQRIRELSTMVEQRRNETSTILERRTRLQDEMGESRLKIETLQHEREQVNQLSANLLGEKQTLETDIASRDDVLRQHRRRHGELQEKRGSLDVELAQKQMAVQNICERIQQKYQVRVEDIRSECITITIADEGAPKVETLSPEDMASRGLATDWDSVAGQVLALQRRLDEIGPVNLVAIEEYEETEQRFNFLNTQHDDLVKAKEQLLEVINRINSQTREMFAETFAKIRENFSALFTEIFGGGKADLALVDEGDVLESGIDILARPPGKQLKSITLLSGGEQTMTAVALLFAIYQVKPSPFCVLDELDAPLDESNINRFIGVLKRFLQYSQFVIITHNKRTIATADVIYGVTMEEQGVSKMVSMRFQKSAGAAAEQPSAASPAVAVPAAFRSAVIPELANAGQASAPGEPAGNGNGNGNGHAPSGGETANRQNEGQGKDQPSSDPVIEFVSAK